MMDNLRLALIHMDIRHKDCGSNRETLLKLNAEAAESGANIIVNPEHSVAGFSFRDRNDVLALAEPETGPSVSQLADLAGDRAVYICLPLAEKDPETGILYNSAFVVGPQGEVIARARKVTADSRWACPGDPLQDAVFETPWGKVGILICSDTFHGLGSRCMALKGVDLLLVPANWPPVWFDPRMLWKARALENGIHVAVCNRTGSDPMLSFLDARSCVFDPEGKTLLDYAGSESRGLFTDLPLKSGRLPGLTRQRIIAARTPESYHAAYLDLRMIDDPTEHYNLPQPGKFWIHCVSPDGDADGSPEIISHIVSAQKQDGWNLFVFSQMNDANATFDRVGEIADSTGVGIFLGLQLRDNKLRWLFAQPGETVAWDEQYPDSREIRDLRLTNFGPARLGIVTPDAFLHPELSVSLSKLGCDVVLISAGTISEADHVTMAVKTVDRLAVAAASSNRSFIRLPPELRKFWIEESIVGTGTCSLVMDTSTTRRKSFQDRVDYGVLFS